MDGIADISAVAVPDWLAGSCPTFIVSRSANGGRLWCGIETARIYPKSMALKLCLLAGAQVMAAALRFDPIDFLIEATARD